MVDKDFSFKSDDINDKVDEKLSKKKTEIPKDYAESVDRIKFAETIRNNPPEEGYMEVDFKECEYELEDGTKKKGVAILGEKKIGDKIKNFILITSGIFAIDLNLDAHWWFDRACTVFPMIIDQSVRTHVDVRDSFKPEKRKIEFPYLWVAVAIVGICMISLLFLMAFKG